ncbi:MAG: hypothetical protein KGO81_15055 [Bacteroidota bacterium]|nr:hypothetical protein [Bacteroidota bacterium]
MFLFKDNLKLGLALGLLAPFIGMLGFYYWKFDRLSLYEFIQYLGIEKRLITGMISFSLMANAILFTLYVNNHKDKTAKGIFLVTIIWAITAIIFKVVY